MSKWISQEKAMSLLVNGFVSWVIKQLPLEYAWELNRLIELEMEWSVW
jgi:Fe-S cluster assembly protein SufB